MLVPALSHLFSNQRALSCPACPMSRRLCPGFSTFIEGAHGLSLPELLRHAGRELWLWWVKGMRTAYRQGMFSDLDTRAALEAAITKDAGSGVRQWVKRGT